MAFSTVFFDLDGTLTDSGQGIMNCAQLALDHYGIPVARREDLRVFVGPPLRDTFRKFGIPREEIENAVGIFRQRYQTVGKFENFPYPGIRELLEALSKTHTLFVATSKPESMAVEILEKFGLAPFFQQICGADMDGARDSKEAVIAYLLEKCGTPEHVVMVGDTGFDVIGAAAHHIPTIGVSWGYGSRQELRAAGAIAIADSPAQLPALLR